MFLNVGIEFNDEELLDVLEATACELGLSLEEYLANLIKAGLSKLEAEDLPDGVSDISASASTFDVACANSEPCDQTKES